MSINVTTAFVQQYSANVQMLSQQMGSLLRDAVRVESVTGKMPFSIRSAKLLLKSVQLAILIHLKSILLTLEEEYH